MPVGKVPCTIPGAEQTRVAPNRRTPPTKHIQQLPSIARCTPAPLKGIHTHKQYNILGVLALTTEKLDRGGKEGCQSLLQFCSVRQDGGQLSFLLEKKRLETLSPEQTLARGDRGRNSLPHFPARAGISCVWFGLEGVGREDFSRMNRLVSLGVSPSNSFWWGGKLLQGERCQRRVRT